MVEDIVDINDATAGRTGTECGDIKGDWEDNSADEEAEGNGDEDVDDSADESEDEYKVEGEKETGDKTCSVDKGEVGKDDVWRSWRMLG